MKRKAHRLPSDMIASLRKDGKVLFFSSQKSILKDNDVNKFRFSTIVSKKVSASAVTRNQIKRRIYHALQEIHAPERLRGVDMLCIINPTIHSSTYQDTKESLEKAINTYTLKK
jgi:ribonuclease P protein component